MTPAEAMTATVLGLETPAEPELRGRDLFEAYIDRHLATLGSGEAELADIRRGYGDWLDEQNTPEDAALAEAQRYMADNNRRAVFNAFFYVLWVRQELEQDGWYWFFVVGKPPVDRPNVLPAEDGQGWIRNPYPTRRDAEEALAKGLESKRDERRGGG